MTQDQDRLPAGARLRLGGAPAHMVLRSLPPVFSPDGERMLVEDREGSSRLHVVAVRTGQRLETLPLLSGARGWVLATNWTAEGLRVLCHSSGPPVLLRTPSAAAR